MDDEGDPRQDLKIRSVLLSGNYAQVKSDPVYGRLLRWRALGYTVDSAPVPTGAGVARHTHASGSSGRWCCGWDAVGHGLPRFAAFRTIASRKFSRNLR